MRTPRLPMSRRVAMPARCEGRGCSVTGEIACPVIVLLHAFAVDPLRLFRMNRMGWGIISDCVSKQSVQGGFDARKQLAR